MDWKERIEIALASLRQQDLGYPQGLNEVRAPSARAAEVPRELRSLYSECDGLSLSDVHNGYFIDTIERFSSRERRGEPSSLAPRAEKILVFGSDGGGARFAVRCGSGQILCLPSGGAVLDGVFVPQASTTPVEVAKDLELFLQRLAEDVEASVSGTPGHRYL
jgi:hypothetical protein